jgi:hypothetical protein
MVNGSSNAISAAAEAAALASGILPGGRKPGPGGGNGGRPPAGGNSSGGSAPAAGRPPAGNSSGGGSSAGRPPAGGSSSGAASRPPAAGRPPAGENPPEGATTSLKNYKVMSFNIQEVMKLLTLTLPYFVVFLFIMLSIINSNIKGFILFFGLIIVYIIIKLFQGTVPESQDVTICNIFDSYHYVHPSFISALYAYTITFILTPMAIYESYNIPLIIILLVFSVIDVIVRFKFGCTKPVPILLGTVIGAAIAVIWVYILKSSGNSSLLYYDDLVSNKQSCSRPTNEQFKCSVYKNGELLNTINSNSNLGSTQK